MKILLFVPYTRDYAAHRASIEALGMAGHSVTVHYQREGDDPTAHRWVNVTAKYRLAREMSLNGGYDALFCVEDDIVVPPDALLKLIAADADIAYGLVTWRREPHCWSAAYVTGPGESDHITFDMDMNKARAAWGRVIDVIGCGLFCTLIRRNVLEALDFRLPSTARCCDFYHAWDAYAAGFTQRCDTTVLCGHIMEDGRVVYADVDTRYRYEEMVTA